MTSVFVPRSPSLLAWVASLDVAHISLIAPNGSRFSALMSSYDPMQQDLA